MMQHALKKSAQLGNHSRTRSAATKVMALIGLVFSLASVAHAGAIPQQISFQNVMENKDVALGEGASLFQDSEGYMWFGGSNALIRYDGYDFKQVDISLSADGKEKAPVKFTEQIFEDSQHNIWVGSRGGLLKYDRRKERLTKVKDDDNQPQKLSASQIFRFAELTSGEIIACGGVGIYIIDPATDKYSVLMSDPNSTNGLRGVRVSALYVEDPNTIWFATDSGLEKLDWKTKTFSFYQINSEHSNNVAEGRVTDLVPDGTGKFWLATRSGLVHYDPATRTGKRYLNNPSDRFSLSSNDLWKLLLDSQGILWIATDGGGVSVYDKDKDRFYTHKFEPGRAGSLNTNTVRTLLEDKDGNIWIGNYPGGINYFDRASAAITTYTNDASNPYSISASRVTSVAEDKNANLWIGTGGGGGVNFLNRETGEFIRFKSDPSDPTTLSDNIIHDTYVDRAGIVWVATHNGGMSTYDPSTRKFTRLPFDTERKITEPVTKSQRLNSATVWTIKEDSTQTLWMATHTGGLSAYNRDTKEYTHYSHIEGNAQSISGNLVWTTLEDSRGNFWVCTASGLNLMDRTKGTFKNIVPDPNDPNTLSDVNVPSIYEDSKHRLWVGAINGLNLFDRDTGTVTVFNKKSGFNNDFIRHILEDADGLIWVATDNGFSSLNPETKQIKNYNRVAGRLVGDFAYRSGIVSRQGEIIFGGTNGMRIINTKALTENKNPPPVAFTDFKLFTDTVEVGGPDGLLSDAVNHTQKIVLNYKQSMFVFDFTALNYRDPTSNKYAFKLEGFDEDWLNAGNQRAAKYTNLNAGTYIFKVKASNNDGVWNEDGKSITLVQLPPPWKTWWAYCLYAFAVAVILLQFIQSQRRKRRFVEEQNRLLEIKVTERTAEVREKSKDIQIMLANMRQGLFTLDATGRVHPEYSRFLEEIFEADNLAGRNALVMLFGSTNLGSDALDQMTQSVGSIIGEDEMNYTFNSHLLITEYEANFNGITKCLSLDWAPVIAGDIIVKLMVSVRDVTELKKMEMEARAKKRELDIISQLLNIPAKKYLSFAASTQRFIDDNRKQIEAHSQRDEPAIALLFRNMHTIKGNCRTFGFDHFSNVVHEVESRYSELKKSPEATWDREQLLADLTLVDEMLIEYEGVYYGVLGRGDTVYGNRDANGCWADSHALNSIQQSIDLAYNDYPALQATKPLLPVQRWLDRALSTSLQEVLADIIESLPSIAVQLEKDAPQVVLDDNYVRIKTSATELITNIFSHILRNAVDHGIERPAQRLHAGKASNGRIEIRALPQSDKLLIHIKDDGQGINIDKLFAVGVQLGRWRTTDKPSYAEVGQLIFASGVTTKDSVTNISGRGVGMDAVKAFLAAQQGDVRLQLLGANATANQVGQGDMVAFELVVELPVGAFTVA